jgi:hypothetical protein
MTEEQKRDWHETVNSVSVVVADPAMYGLLMLLALTRPDESAKSVTKLVPIYESRPECFRTNF